MNVIEIDLNGYMHKLDIIMSKYISIENLEYCFFSKDKRYPLDKTKLSLYKKGTLANKPILPLLSSGIVMDTIRYFLYNIYNSNITKHYFNNGLISDEDYRILNNTEDNPYSIAPYEFKSLESLIYHHLDKLDHLNRDSKVLRTHKELYDKYCSTYGKDFLKKEKATLTKESMGIKNHLELQILNKKNIEKRKIAKQYYNELWENKLLVYDEYQDTKIYFDTLEIENILYKIIDVLYAQDIRPQRVYKLDDESPRHKIIMGEDIFELRFKEAGKL